MFLIALVIMVGSNSQSQQIVKGTMPEVISKSGLQSLGRLDNTKNLHLGIALPLRNEEALNNLLQQIYDPTNPNYHHYLTLKQFTSEFGPTEQDYRNVIEFAKANGLNVDHTYPNNSFLDVSGPVAKIENALHIKMSVYKHPTEARTFYAPDKNASLDISVPILQIIGLNNYASPPKSHLSSSPTFRTIRTESAGADSGFRTERIVYR